MPKPERESRLSSTEIQDRGDDLEKVFTLCGRAAEKVRAASVLLKEASGLYREAERKCSVSPSNRYALVVRSLHIKPFMTTVDVARSRMDSVVLGSHLIRARESDSIREAVMDPELLK